MKRIIHLGKVLLIGSLVITSSGVQARGGHGYGYGHHGYKSHYGYGVHYRHHGHGDAAGYLVLGLIGGAILTTILTQSQYERERDYAYEELPRRQPYGRARYEQPGQEMYLPEQRQPVSRYRDYEGWDWLERGYAEKAMNIFAMQSQEDLDAGMPRVGFALAAAINGEKERGTRSMRKALEVDPDALRYINITRGLQPAVDDLSREYELLALGDYHRPDEAFMLATLSYLQKDYETAHRVISDSIADGDYSQSTRNLKVLLDKELKRS
jgi:hypothetical protein